MIKSKPRQFKPTHLKVRLIMTVELVMRMSEGAFVHLGATKA